MTSTKSNILLIDDEEEKLQSLAQKVRENVVGTKVNTWHPKPVRDLTSKFSELADEETVLVVTDYDLTKSVTGLFGHSVVAWCRSKFIPVGDFTRGHQAVLSEEPDLFELRVPRNERTAAKYIALVSAGFDQIRSGIEQNRDWIRESGNPAQVLAKLLGRENMESQLGPYLSKPSLFNSSLLDSVTSTLKKDAPADEAEKIRLLTYILGHILVNAILKYPGPILSEGPLCAYLATPVDEIRRFVHLFKSARYTGPFANDDMLFWREDVDLIVEDLADQHSVNDSEFESFGNYRRAVVSASITERLGKHDCVRCSGESGGFWCPFTRRAVCERSDCSSTASSWIPSGAYACRVEKVFFDEWAPILGL